MGGFFSFETGSGFRRLVFLLVDILLTFCLLLSQSIVVVGALSGTQKNDVAANKGSTSVRAARSLTPSSSSSCGLYWAPAVNRNNDKGRSGYALYSGVKVNVGDPVGPQGEPLIPMTDANMNEWSPWHEFVWDPNMLLVPPSSSAATTAVDAADASSSLSLSLSLESGNFLNSIYVPGIASLAACSSSSGSGSTASSDVVNVALVPSTNASVSLANHDHNFSYYATEDIEAGDEIFTSCPDSDDDERANGGDGDWGGVFRSLGGSSRRRRQRRDVPWLRENGLCLDDLTVGPSTIPGAGRGAFARHDVKANRAIAVSPVLHFDRSQMDVVEQVRLAEDDMDIEASSDNEGRRLLVLPPSLREHNIQYRADNVTGKQLLLNYCYGHPDSNLLFLPYGPAVNMINHNLQEANAYIRWSKHAMSDADSFWNRTPDDFFASEAYFAPSEKASTSSSRGADDGTGDHGGPLVVEFIAKRDISAGEEIWIDYGDEWSAAWEDHHVSAGRDSGEERDVNDFLDVHDSGEVSVTVPSANGADEPYYDVHHHPELPAFRREIGVPDGFYSPRWMAKTSSSVTTTPDNPREHDAGVDDDGSGDVGDFIASPLTTGQLAPMRWSDSTGPVTPYGFRLGLNPRVREKLLEFCDRMGITELFRHVTYRDNGLPPGTDISVEWHGCEWSLQRRKEPWQSNFHWLSPADESSQENYLQALSAAGWDDVLDALGRYLNMDGLLTFRVSFFAVSHSTREPVHRDVTGTGGKAYRLIVPLLLVNETRPELELRGEKGRAAAVRGTVNENTRLGRYRYEYDVALVIGDNAYHAPAAVDHRGGNQMRMAASIYVADVNKNNVDSILNEEQVEQRPYHPTENRDLLLSLAGRHWKRDDPTIKLPKPDLDHISSARMGE